jgi:hypothetical protein
MSESLYKFKIEITDEATEEVIYSDWAYSMDSLEEKFFKVDRVLEKHRWDRIKEEEQRLEDLKEKDEI